MTSPASYGRRGGLRHDPAIAKSVVASSEVTVLRAVEQVPSEIVRYRLVVDVAEGHTVDLVVTDPLVGGSVLGPSGCGRCVARPP